MQNLKRRLSVDELMAEARGQQIQSLEIKLAVLETSDSISFIEK